MNNEIDNRLRWKCRRGMLELDILLQNFLENGFVDLGDNDKKRFEQLLEYEDNPLFELLMDHMQSADPSMKHVIQSIQRATLAQN
ncbi:MAG: succinate dehydrogenase assembly factor 2 [Cocleimonas sp.]